MPIYTDYTGNAGLGLGSNKQIPVSTTKDLDVINQTADRLMQMNAAQNYQLFQQKVKDRDTLYAALDSGDIKVGDLLEQDMPTVKEGLDALDNAYFERVNKGINDLDAAKKYKQALRDAQDRVTQAQARKLFFDNENGAVSKENLPSKQQARKQNLDKSLKSFWSDLTPYVPALDFNHPEMNQSILKDALMPKEGVGPQDAVTDKVTTTTKDGKVTVSKTQTTAPGKATQVKNAVTGGVSGKLSPFSTIPGKFYSYDKILANASDDFVHDEAQRNNQATWLGSIQNGDPAASKQVIDYTNERIGQYNKQRGLSPGDKGFVEKISVIIDPNGRLQINSTPTEFAAKTALASLPGNFVEEDQVVFNKDIGSYLQDKAELASLDKYRKGQLAIERDRLNFDKEKAKAAGVPLDAANSAKEYAIALFKKLNGLADNGGVISPEKLKSLTSDELKYLGTSLTTENKFSLRPLDLSEVKSIQMMPDGTMQVIKSDGTITSNAPAIDIKQVATNKLGDEMTLTTGKEGVNYNTLISLYGSGGEGGASGTINISEVPAGTKLEKKGGKYFYNGKEVTQ